MTLPQHCHRQVHINASEDLSTARFIVAELSMGIEMTSTQRERFNLIVSELGTNLLRHTPNGGTLLLRRLIGRAGLECICFDRGPGIADLGASLQDGESSVCGLGYGLGAIRRLSDEFDIHSELQQGTAILSRVCDARVEPAPPLQTGAVMLAMAGQDECGDGWVVRSPGLIAVIDGLGHGPEASIAARRAEMTTAAGYDDPCTAIDAMHSALRGTRGAVAMVALLRDGHVDFAGVGNIAGAVIGVDKVTRLHSSWGVVGARLTASGRHQIAWRPGDVLLCHSDGISQAVEVFGRRRLRYVEPTLACAIIMRDGICKLDDQTVLMVRR